MPQINFSIRITFFPTMPKNRVLVSQWLIYHSPFNDCQSNVRHYPWNPNDFWPEILLSTTRTVQVHSFEFALFLILIVFLFSNLVLDLPSLHARMKSGYIINSMITELQDYPKDH